MAATVRKAISKDDYKFFIGRVEKISNGQVAFIADTQKKAVELLGEKIPQNVIDAENNYKAFNIWLGSEINPIIVGEGGYKEEIRVFGDGYDFFEVKAETGNTEFKYYLKSNRPLFGAVPSGYVHAEKFENAVRIPRHGYVFGTAIYNKPLTDEQVRIYDVKPDKNNPQPEDNTAAVSEVSSSIDNIFAAVTAEIKPHIRGKYFVQINDNWREQEIREKFSTLEDAVRVAWIMYSELCKVSRHIYATVEARTVDINKLWNRADDWTTFYEINSDGEKINRRETIEVISKIDNRTVEEVRNDIGRCGYNYGFYKNSAPVEEANAEIIACLDDYIVNVDAAAEVEIENAAAEVEAEKNSLKAKVAKLKATEKIISEKYLSLCRSLYVKIDGEYQTAVGFDDYVTKYHDTFYCKEGNDYVEDTTAYHELKEIEREWNALFKEFEYFENIAEKAEVLKAKIAEQKNSRKPIIDWSGTFEDMKISEILNLQKEFKKFLKLGQIELAENVFSMLKTLCKNYREQFAA